MEPMLVLQKPPNTPSETNIKPQGGADGKPWSIKRRLAPLTSCGIASFFGGGFWRPTVSLKIMPCFFFRFLLARPFKRENRKPRTKDQQRYGVLPMSPTVKELLLRVNQRTGFEFNHAAAWSLRKVFCHYVIVFVLGVVFAYVFRLFPLNVCLGVVWCSVFNLLFHVLLLMCFD